MSTLFITVLIAGILAILCGLGMAIGWIITGKSKLSCRRCGKPEKDSKGCSICKKK